MNSCIFVVLVLLLEAHCRPAGQDVLAGEDFLAVLMRSHRPRPEYYHKPTTTQATTQQTTAAETEAPTTLVTEPPRVVSVRVSSSVRKEAVHEPVHEPVHEAVSASAQISHFSVESSGYREERREEDSIAEASQDNQESLHVEENKPFAQALTLQDPGIHYESRVSSETSQSRIYFSQPKPLNSAVVIQSQVERKYQPQVLVTHPRDGNKYEPHILTSPYTQENRDRKYEAEIQQIQDVKPSSQIIFTQGTQESKVEEPTILPDDGNFGSKVGREETKYGPEVIVVQTHTESKYTPRLFESQTESQNSADVNKEDNSASIAASLTEEARKYLSQNREQRQYSPPPLQIIENQSQDSPATEQTIDNGQYRHEDHNGQERNYEQPEENYEVDEAISVMTNGRAHGVQTESPSNNKFGSVQEGRDYRKYRVEEKTPDGFIVGEYGVVNHDGGSIRGVRYTADGSINPRLIYEALVKFLSLK